MSSIKGDKQTSVNDKNFNQDQIDSINGSQENTTQPACLLENATQPKLFTSSCRGRQPKCTLKFDNCNKRSSESSEVSSLLNNGIKMRTKLNLNLRLNKMLKERSLVVDMLAIFFGIGTWVGINGTFIQLPLLVEIAPEGWSLPSYLSVMVQIGNLGPLIYTLFAQKNSATKDTILIYGLLTLGTISALLTAFFYSETAIVFGQEHSVALFVLTFLTAINACSSSVLFMPYMGRFKEIYLVTYFVGEGLSGLLPSVVALIQGIGTTECILTNTTSEGEKIYEKNTPPPLFDTKVFFIFIFAMMVLSCGGFFLLDRLKLAKEQYANVGVIQDNNYVCDTDTKPTPSRNNDSETEGQSKLTSNQYVFMLLLIAAICFFANGVFNSIQSYSCLPYGSAAYHLSATLSVIANPIACFLAIFLGRTSLRSICTLTGLASLLTIYVLVTAAMSPKPPLVNSEMGKILVIFIWTLLIGLVSYIKLSISTVMHSQGGKSLVWTGCVVQVGSLVGSLLIFVLINFTGSFKAAYNDNDPC
ncbi:solute carrier family 52, riboflavin transporter, member 3-A isoform X1 [Glossina fuscipes]|uniref:Riboflavin transporter n=1 Tax=Glossina fuscipes TaxID=7396 RepID=A0A8U0WHE9_9MUSC|nr:solute carrier family 52, riboflavin transporter, member 3-A isoform X1 [Glossina fuscipes]